MQARIAEIEDAFSSAGVRVFFISAIAGEGVDELMAETMKLLSQAATSTEAEEKVQKKVFRPQPAVTVPDVYKDGNTFVVSAPELERIVAKADLTSPRVRLQLKRQLAGLGVSKVLERKGIKPGDKIRCGNLEWEW